MRLLNCPKPESLLELVSISGELPLLEKTSLKSHCLLCPICREKLNNLKSAWESYSEPEPDITSSLLKVYSRLQNDETLILKGWKLGRNQPRSSNPWRTLLDEGWLLKGSLSAAAVVLIMLASFTWLKPSADKSHTLLASQDSAEETPLMQIRYENNNRVQVHYVQPELLQTIEFETTSFEGR